MKGLIIRDPWIGMILSGSKTWELRTQHTAIRGEIALIRKGTAQIVGVAELIDSLAPLDTKGLGDSVQFHGVPMSEHASVIANGWLHPWLIVNAKPLSSPVPYLRPSGAVTWVNLDPDIARSIVNAMQESLVSDLPRRDRKRPRAFQAARPEHPYGAMQWNRSLSGTVRPKPEFHLRWKLN